MKTKVLSTAILSLFALTSQVDAVSKHHTHRHESHHHVTQKHHNNNNNQHYHQRPLSLATTQSRDFDHTGVSGSRHVAYDYAEDSSESNDREKEVEKARTLVEQHQITKEKQDLDPGIIRVGKDGDYKVFNQFDGLYHHKDGSLEASDGETVGGANSFSYDEHKTLANIKFIKPTVHQKSKLKRHDQYSRDYDGKSYPYGQIESKKNQLAENNSEQSHHIRTVKEFNSIAQFNKSCLQKCQKHGLIQMESKKLPHKPNDTPAHVKLASAASPEIEDTFNVQLYKHHQKIGNVDVSDRNMDDIDIALSKKKEAAQLKQIEEEKKEEARLDRQNKIGPDGIIHEEDGTKIDPETNKEMEDESDLVDDKGKKLPKKDEFAAGAAAKNRKRKSDKKAKKEADEKMRLAKLNPFDGLIHMENGEKVDPNDDTVVAPCQCI